MYLFQKNLQKAHLGYYIRSEFCFKTLLKSFLALVYLVQFTSSPVKNLISETLRLIQVVSSSDQKLFYS